MKTLNELLNRKKKWANLTDFVSACEDNKIKVEDFNGHLVTISGKDYGMFDGTVEIQAEFRRGSHRRAVLLTEVKKK